MTDCLSLTQCNLSIFHLFIQSLVFFLAEPGLVPGPGDREILCPCPEKLPAWAGDRHREDQTGGTHSCPEVCQVGAAVLTQGWRCCEEHPNGSPLSGSQFHWLKQKAQCECLTISQTLLMWLQGFCLEILWSRQ